MIRTGRKCQYRAGAGIILTLLLCSALLCAPVSAATKYLGGAPVFSASVSGTNEFVPGEDVTISILVKNTGINQMKQQNIGTIEPDDIPTTAKTVTIGLASSDDAVIVKTDPQMVGDIPGNGVPVTVPFNVKISTNATAGTYELPLTIQYRYAKETEQDKADVFEYRYNDAEDTIPVTLKIKPEVKVEIVDAVPTDLSVGSEGYLNLTIRNAGPGDGEKTVVKLIRNGRSPIIPADNSVFVGHFQSGDVITCRYKVAVADDAISQSYPVDVTVSYTNREGVIVTSPPETAGILVKPKTSFSIVSPVAEVPAGTTDAVEVQFRNEGDSTIYGAQARIKPHDPVTIKDDTVYLGDIGPGMTKSAWFTIAVDDDAGAMLYSFDSSIRYRDTLDNSYESDTLPVQIRIVPAVPGIPWIPGGFPAMALCAVAGIIVCIGLLVQWTKKKNQ